MVSSAAAVGVSAQYEDASPRWVALARDPSGVFVAVGPVARQRAEMIARALAEGFEELEPLGRPGCSPRGGRRAAAGAAARQDTAKTTENKGPIRDVGIHGLQRAFSC